jgi:CBS domain-containing protein
MRVRDVMTHDVVTLAPTTPVAAIADLLVTHHINGAPVVDDNGRLVGLVNAGGLLHRAADERLAEPASVWRENFWRRTSRRASPERDRAEGRAAAEVMTQEVLTVTPATDLVSVARALLEHDIQAVPVLTHTTLSGIISRHDILTQLAAHGGTLNPLEH